MYYAISFISNQFYTSIFISRFLPDPGVGLGCGTAEPPTCRTMKGLHPPLSTDNVFTYSIVAPPLPFRVSTKDLTQFDHLWKECSPDFLP